MKRNMFLVVLFLAIALVTTGVVFTASAQQGRWILVETLINPNNEPLEWIPPGTGYEGSIIRWTVNETSMTEEDRSVRNGFEWYDVSLTATFDKPPTELTPGETIMLSITYSYSGTLIDYSPGIAFDYMLDGEVLTGDPDIPGFAPWSPYFDGLTSSTYSVLVPSAHSGEMKITAFLLNRAACNVTWVYQAEETTTTVSSSTTIEPTTTTTTNIVPNLELTYPAGYSPKVFTQGWVFGAKCTYTDDEGIEVDISNQVSWGGTGTFSPDKGSRSYPSFNNPRNAGQHTIELSVEINGEVYKEEFPIAAVPSTNYARLSDKTWVDTDAHGCFACPHHTVGPIISGSPIVSIINYYPSGINILPAARVGDIGVHAACCGPNMMFAILTGDENVLIDGRPAARKGDITEECGGRGRITTGSPGPSPVSLNPLKNEAHTCSIPTKVGLRADEGGGTISGKVTDDTAGAGILGVGVTAYGDTNIDVWGAITDANGEYQITGLPDDSFRVNFWGGNLAYNAGYLSSWYNEKSGMDAADIVTITGAGSVSDINATLSEGGSISGTVKDASGTGIEKVSIAAYGEYGGMSFGSTDGSGSYQIGGLASDSYRVSCDAGSKGYIAEWYNDKSSQDSADPVTVTAPSKVSDIDFTLTGSGGISGTVKDESGNGIEGVYVKAFGESAGMGVTDLSGAYEILGIPDDSYRVQFQGASKGYSNQWYNSKSGWDTAELVTVTAPNKTTGIDAELSSSGEITTTTTSGSETTTTSVDPADAEWSPMDFSSGTDDILYDIWGTSATNVYAVGASGLIIRYDGDGDDDSVSDNRWDPPVSSATTNDLYAIWGASASTVYAVGASGTVFNYDGSDWTDTSATLAAEGDLFGIWGASSNDLFITSDGVIYHTSGAAWTTQLDLSGNSFRGIWGSASDDVVTVDFTGGNIYHYNGVAWDTTPMGTAEEKLFNTWGSSASDIYAVGWSGTLVHYDGSSWSPVTSVSTGTNHLTAIWGSSANDIYAVGWGGTIIHYDGTTWSHMASGTQDNLWNVWGDGNGKVFAVGGNIGVGPIALRYTPDAATTTTVPGTITTTTTTTNGDVCPAGEIYGENSVEAELLRYFRDNVLSKTPEGQEIIRLYYQLSPAIVKAIEEDEAFKEEVRGMIDGVLELIGE